MIASEWIRTREFGSKFFLHVHGIMFEVKVKVENSAFLSGS